jgi:hypothetical protein
MVSPAKASYSSDSEDNIPLSQIKSPVSRRLVRRAEFDPMEEEEQEAVEKEGFYNSEIGIAYFAQIALFISLSAQNKLVCTK